MTNVGYYVLLISALIPGLALVASGLSKWLNLTWFAGVLLKYKVLPRSLVKLLAVLIPAGELILGILLMVDHRRPWPAYGALFLFILFTGAVVTNLFRGRSTLPCGCSGFLKKAKIRWGLVARNMGFCGFVYLVLNLQNHGAIGGVEVLIFALSGILVATAFLPAPSCNKRTQAILIPKHVS